MDAIKYLKSIGYVFELTQDDNISFNCTRPVTESDINVIKAFEEIKANKPLAIDYLVWCEQLLHVVAVDIETTGLDPRVGEIKCVSYATNTMSGVTESVTTIQDLLADETVLKVFHNAAFDVHYLELNGFKVNNYTDSMVMAQVLSNNQGEHTLKHLVEQELGITLSKTLQQATNWQQSLGFEHYLYSMCDAAVTRLLTLELAKQIDEKALFQVLNREIKALPAIVRLEKDGMPFDKLAWETQLCTIQQETDALKEEILGDLQTSINLNSPKALAQCLQNRGIPASNTTDEVLASLEDSHPVISKIRAYRKYSKILSLSGPKWLGYVQYNGRIYPSWRLIGTTTGRMTCAKPNLQQVPHLLRPHFKAQEGYCFLVADYSQIELRVITALTGDPEMVEAYKNNVDLHEKTAAMILGTQKISKQDRQIAKAANFGLIYGMSLEGLQQQVKSQYGLELSKSEAAKFKNGFFRLYRNIKHYHNKQLQKPKIITLGGRYWTNIPQYPNRGWRNRYNYEVQGTAADGLKEALALLHPQLSDKWRLCAVVHDEIVLEVPLADIAIARKVLQESMIQGMQKFIKNVPIIAEVEVASVWQK